MEEGVSKYILRAKARTEAQSTPELKDASSQTVVAVQTADQHQQRHAEGHLVDEDHIFPQLPQPFTERT